jgi:serine protease
LELLFYSLRMDKDVHKKQAKRVTVRRTLPQYLVLSGVVLFAGCGGGSGSSESQPPAIDLGPLSGVISIESGSRIDQDTMDQLRRQGSTAASTIQSLPAGFVLAGYVSGSAGGYPSLRDGSDPFPYALDERDVFRIPLNAGETITLQNFGGRAGDSTLELRLEIDGLADVVGEVTPGGVPATVSLPDGVGTDNDSDVFYQVSVINKGLAPARYVLLKTAGESSGEAFDWPRYEFVSGEAIVQFDSSETEIGALSLAAFSSQMGRPARQLGASTWLMAKGPSAAISSFSSLGDKQQTLNWVRELRGQPGVKSAEPNYRFSSQQSAPSPLFEPLYSSQWHYDLIDTPTAWQLSPKAGSGVTVAVLDSGLFRDDQGDWHPDLAGNLADWGSAIVDFVSAPYDVDREPTTSGGRDNNPADPGSPFGDNVFHGTHVAGIIGAAVNGLGGTGVAYNASILPLRVLGVDRESRSAGTGSSADLIDALVWVAGGLSGPPRAEIVNMSLGGLPSMTSLQNAIDLGVGRGVLYVAAAGNTSSSVPSFPAAARGVLAVSAVDGGRGLAPYSNFGNWIDLAAPGGSFEDNNSDGSPDLIWSASALQQSGEFVADYRGLQGTSMAAPHVAGVLALMRAENESLNMEMVNQWLREGLLTDSIEERSDAFGWGLINAAKAVSAATNALTATVLSASPALVSLSDEGADVQVIDLNVFGPGVVDEIGIVSKPDWLVVSLIEPENVDRSLRQLEVSLIRDRLTPGMAFRGNIEVSYSVDGRPSELLTIPAVGQRISDEQARNAGAHFVLLVDTTPDDDGFYWAEAQVAVEASNGSYGFRFESWDGEEPRRINEVSPGDYFLVAGTDIDGDGIICQPGEACAEYPISGLREVITIEEGQSLSDLRMTTSFTRPTISAETPDILPRPGFQGYRLITPERDSARNNSDNRPRTTQ